MFPNNIVTNILIEIQNIMNSLKNIQIIIIGLTAAILTLLIPLAISIFMDTYQKGRKERAD